jgi:hypothetical protein
MKKIALRLKLERRIPAVLYEGKGLPAVQEEPGCCFQTPVNLTTGHADFLDMPNASPGTHVTRGFEMHVYLTPN